MIIQGDGSVLIEGARTIFRNFAGAEGPYNRDGDRNFCVLLDPSDADELISAGWNVKGLRAREEGESDQPYIQVSVNFKGRPPRIVIIGEQSRKRTHLDEESCETLDWVDIANVDLIFRPYNWTVRDASGIKAYLRTIYVTVREDYLDLKYADLESLPKTED